MILDLMKYKRMSEIIYVCENCGSHDVQTKMWVDVNDSNIIDGYASDLSEEEDNWCRHCEDHYKIITQSEYIDKIIDDE